MRVYVCVLLNLSQMKLGLLPFMSLFYSMCVCVWGGGGGLERERAC